MAAWRAQRVLNRKRYIAQAQYQRLALEDAEHYCRQIVVQQCSPQPALLTLADMNGLPIGAASIAAQRRKGEAGTLLGIMHAARQVWVGSVDSCVEGSVCQLAGCTIECP